ncbi:MAG: 16S rRNA (cytosine(967)-C(5))-methyltransferase RsmB [Candidatus Zixiibacteriota bacterium]
MAKKEIKYDPVRGAAIEAIGLVESGKFSTDEAIAALIEKKPFRPLDIRFLRQLVNGVIKMKRRLDHEIKFYLSKPSEKIPRRLADILRLGFYQLRFTDRIPSAAAVSESVNLAHYFCDLSRARLVNAVLRAALRKPDKVVFRDKNEEPEIYLADYYSYPEWFVKYCLNEFQLEETEKLLEGMNQAPLVSFRSNSLMVRFEQITKALDDAKLKYSRGRYINEYFHLEEGGIPLEKTLVETGKIYIQDESAGMAVRLLDPKKSSRVLDMAAAPGGKTTYIAARMRNEGMITAIDKSRKRLELLVSNCKRLGVTNVNPVAADNLEFKGGPFDRVLLDAPCSGWGNAGKHSDLRWSKSKEDIETLFKIQSMMLDRAAKLVEPGGVLVYSTCTIIRNENDQVIEEFLLRNKNFSLESASQFFTDDVVNERGFLKTYPNIPNLSGSFAARLCKKVKNK